MKKPLKKKRIKKTTAARYAKKPGPIWLTRFSAEPKVSQLGLLFFALEHLETRHSQRKRGVHIYDSAIPGVPHTRVLKSLKSRDFRRKGGMLGFPITATKTAKAVRKEPSSRSSEPTKTEVTSMRNLAEKYHRSPSEHALQAARAAARPSVPDANGVAKKIIEEYINSMSGDNSQWSLENSALGDGKRTLWEYYRDGDYRAAARIIEREKSLTE